MTDTAHGHTAIAIARIVREGALQVRRKVDQAAMARYAHSYRNSAPMPPVKLADVNGALYLVDGWHRLAALDSIGIGTVEAVTTPCASLVDAAWLAAEANLTHGLPLRKAELRGVFRAFMRAGRHHKGKSGLRSFREISAGLGGVVPHTTVRNWMMRDFPKIARRYGGGSEALTEAGGHRPHGAPGSPKATAMTAADQALAAFAGITELEGRGEVIAKVLEVAEAMKAAGPWVAPVEVDF